MSLKRVFIFTCDACKTEFIKADYGLPKGWIYLPKLVRADSGTHHCEKCKK